MLTVHFFFFQAEDGIRVRDVTGVQTCALPILRGAARTATSQLSSPEPTTEMLLPTDSAGCVRSEERRVGKECRSRGAPDPEKKKTIGKSSMAESRSPMEGEEKYEVTTAG